MKHGKNEHMLINHLHNHHIGTLNNDKLSRSIDTSEELPTSTWKWSRARRSTAIPRNSFTDPCCMSKSDDAPIQLLIEEMALRRLWSDDKGGSTADSGQDSRGAPDLIPLRTIQDCTPEGRGTDWYPARQGFYSLSSESSLSVTLVQCQVSRGAKEYVACHLRI